MRSTRASALDVGRSSVVGGEGGARGSLLAALANAGAGAGSAQVDGQQQLSTVRNSISSTVPAATLTVPTGPTGAVHDLNELAGTGGNRGSLLGRPPVAVQSLSIRQYLDLLVVPTLLPALTTVVTERPDRPVEFLAHWLLENAHKYSDPASPTDFATTVALLGGGGAETRLRFSRTEPLMWLLALHCALGMIFLPDNGCVAVSYYTFPKPNANSAANPSGPLQGVADLSFVEAEGATTTKLQKLGMPEGFEDARKSGDEQQDPRTQRTESNRPHTKRPRSRLHRHPRSTANGQEGGAPPFIHIGTPPLRGVKRALAGLVLPLVTGYTSLGIFLYTWGSFELMRYFLEKDLTQVQQLHLNALIYGLRKGKMKAQGQAGHQGKTKGIEGEGGERVHHHEVGTQGASEGEEGVWVHSHEPAPQGESEGEERKGTYRHELIA